MYGHRYKKSYKNWYKHPYLNYSSEFTWGWLSAMAPTQIRHVPILVTSQSVMSPLDHVKLDYVKTDYVNFDCGWWGIGGWVGGFLNIEE